MIAGVILGPSLLGLLFPGFQLTLFPKETKNVLYVGAQLGVGLYMFMVGTSFQADHFKAKAKSAMSVSFAGIAAPFLIAALITPFLLKVPGLFAPTISQGAATLFMGACIALTAFPMLARIINERGLAKTSLGTLSLTAGAFDDAVSWCVLAVVLATFGGGPGVAVLAIGGGVAWVAFVTILGPKILAPLGRMVEREGEMSHTVLALVLLAFCVSAFLMDAVGIHAIFGGFILGVVMPRGKLVEELKRKVEPIAVILLLPMFFTYSGLNTRMDMVNSPQLLLIALGILAASILAKWGACYVAARVTGEPPYGHGHRRPDELARPDGADHHQHRPAEGHHRPDPVLDAGADGDRHHGDGQPAVRGGLRQEGPRDGRTRRPRADRQGRLTELHKSTSQSLPCPRSPAGARAFFWRNHRPMSAPGTPFVVSTPGRRVGLEQGDGQCA